MGTGHRVFLVDDGDRLHRISQKRFDRFLYKDRGESVPEPFIGQDKVRYVFVAYETEQRQPVAILHVDYGRLPLAADGMLDKVRSEEVLHLVGRTFSPLDGDTWIRRRGSVVDADRIFAKKRLNHEWQWQPSVELEEELLEAIFG